MTQGDPVPTQRGHRQPNAIDPEKRKPYIHPTGGLASHPPDDDPAYTDYALEVMRRADRRVHVRRWYNGDPRK